MAQLFQPTNITPDTRGAFGNGVVEIDIESGSGSDVIILPDFVDVAWLVNGNTAMTAFQIDFTDMSGNALYSTGKLYNGCPFYGTNASGETQRFSYRIDLSEEETSFLRQASEGLMKITQWWGSGSNDYVVQQSPSPYLVRKAVTAYFTPNGSDEPVTGRNGTFTGSFSNANPDGMMWTRWVLTRKGTGQVIKDTGRLYGSVEPTFSYDSFLPGVYTLSLTGETSTGVTAINGTYDVYVSYDVSDTGIPVVASRDCNGESAVSVRWPRFQNIPISEKVGVVTDSGTSINLANSNSYLAWNTVNSGTMRLRAPWSIIWSGSVTALSGKLFTVQTANATYEAGVGMSAGFGMVYMTITQSGQPPQLAFFPIEWEEGDFMCCITPSLVYWKCMADKGSALYPRDSLYPAETLYPGGLGGTTNAIVLRNMPTDIPQTAITSVTLHGPSSVKYFEIFDYGMTDVEVNQYLSGEKYGTYDQNTLFYISAEGVAQDYNAGNYPESLQGGTEIDVYRKTGESEILEYVGKTTVRANNEMLDYAARSQQGPYSYYLYVLSSSKYINVPSISNEVNPCFWNWTVLSCTENSDGSYSVHASYNFGKNLQSGSIQNNNQPGIFQNFTQYPTVMIAPQNYQSGTLQSLIGVVSDGEYSDTIDLRDAIYNLSLTTNTLFLKNRKGDLLRIRPSGEISMETMDNTRAQALTVSFPWIEVGDASGVAVYRTGGAS